MLWGQHAHQGISVPFPSSCFPNPAVSIQEQLLQHPKETLFPDVHLPHKPPHCHMYFNNQNTKNYMSWKLPSGLASKCPALINKVSSPCHHQPWQKKKNSTLERCRALLSSHRLAQTKRTAWCPSQLGQDTGKVRKNFPLSTLSAISLHSSQLKHAPWAQGKGFHCVSAHKSHWGWEHEDKGKSTVVLKSVACLGVFAYPHIPVAPQIPGFVSTWSNLSTEQRRTLFYCKYTTRKGKGLKCMEKWTTNASVLPAQDLFNPSLHTTLTRTKESPAPLPNSSQNLAWSWASLWNPWTSQQLMGTHTFIPGDEFAMGNFILSPNTSALQPLSVL